MFTLVKMNAWYRGGQAPWKHNLPYDTGKEFLINRVAIHTTCPQYHRPLPHRPIKEQTSITEGTIFPLGHKD